MDELESKLFWHLLPQCPNSVLLRLQNKFGKLPNPNQILSDPATGVPEALIEKIAVGLKNLDERLNQAASYIRESRLGLLERGESSYPALLDQIPDPPALLYFRGEISALDTAQMAVVGSRASSRSGQRDAYSFASQLGAAGFTITSGLALGIDSAAHRGALDQSGLTIAVIGSGLDKIYPHQNRGLHEQILTAGGLILSEFPPGTPPRRENFPQRNRIISGLALTTLVVEASNRSGSLITARLALEQGREVMVVPGSIHDPLKAGCHRLIRDGACLVESADQVLETAGSLLSFQLDPTNQSARPKIDQEALGGSGLEQLMSKIEFEPTPIEDLLSITKMEALELAEQLTDLELRGLILRTPEGIKRLR